MWMNLIQNFRAYSTRSSLPLSLFENLKQYSCQDENCLYRCLIVSIELPLLLRSLWLSLRLIFLSLCLCQRLWSCCLLLETQRRIVVVRNLWGTGMAAWQRRESEWANDSSEDHTCLGPGNTTGPLETGSRLSVEISFNNVWSASLKGKDGRPGGAIWEMQSERERERESIGRKSSGYLPGIVPWLVLRKLARWFSQRAKRRAQITARGWLFFLHNCERGEMRMRRREGGAKSLFEGRDSSLERIFIFQQIF